MPDIYHKQGITVIYVFLVLDMSKAITACNAMYCGMYVFCTT